MCAGIGIASLAKQRIHPEAQCIGACEVNEEAILVYKWHFDHHAILGVVTEVDVFPKVHWIIGGCPCQSFSVMGHRKGLEDIRGNVFIRVIETLKRTVEAANAPTHVLFENVVMKEELRKSISELLEDALGRKVYLTKLNSEHFSAQDRPRYYWSTFRRKKPFWRYWFGTHIRCDSGSG